MFIVALLSLLLIFSISFGIAGPRETAPEGARIKAVIIGGLISVLILPVFLLVVDYARVWQVTSSKSAGFKAIGVGFRQTFKHFFSSYPVMFINMLIQALFGWFVLKFISGFGPQSGIGIFILFLLSQFLFIIRIFLRVWRYGSVTAMYEKHPG